MKKKITIGMVVKNCEATIGKAIESVLNQDYCNQEIEIIVVDNGSKDETLSIIKKTISKTKLKYKIFQAINKGMGEIRQIVVKNAVGEYILWVDGDIIIPNYYLKRQLELIKNDSRIGVIIGKMEGWKNDTLIPTLENISRSRDYRLNSRKNRTLPRLATGGSLFKTRALQHVGGFESNITGAGEDTEVIIKIKKAGWLIFCSQIVFYHKFRGKMRDSLNQQIWYGYGTHYLKHKSRDQVIIWTRTPIISFIDGFFRSIKAYKITHQKKVFFLSGYNFIKTSAWCLGYLKAHLYNYGH